VDVITLSLALLLAIQDPLQPPPAAQPPETPSWLSRFHGTLAVRYRGRFTSDDRDNDLYEIVTATYGNPDKDAVTASLTARFAEDLDGDRGHEGFYVYDSRDDTYHHATTARVYTAYVDLHRPLPRLSARIGRQILDEMPEAVPMDGALARYGVGEWLTLGGFGGIPVNLFESSMDGDAMFGAWAEAAPGPRSRARLEYLHLRDENVFGLFKDDLLAASVEHGFGPFVAHARYTNLEGESREATGRLTGAFADLGLMVNAQLAYLFESTQALSYAIDPFSIFLLDLEPYWQASLTISKTLGPRFSVDASAVVRELAKDDDETDYNHEFRRYSLTPRTSDWPLRGLSLAVSLDFWQSSADDFWTAGGDATWAVTKDVRIGVGTSFALYTIDAATGEERERVRSVYATFRWRFVKDTTLDVRASIDRDPDDTYTTIDVGVRRAF
jgi:hypothetical protein